MRGLWPIGLTALLGACLWPAAGCTPLSQARPDSAPPTARGAQPEMPPEMLPQPPQEGPPPARLAPAESRVHVVPITLDTVLRLAQDKNGQINLARAKVSEAFAARELAGKRWIPDLYAGPSYYRHEGGIQDFTGNLIHSSFGSLFAGVEIHGRIDLRELVFAKVDAERKIWQQQAELAKLTSENLLDAVNTYIDLLAARSGEAIGRQMENYLADVAKRAADRAQKIPRAKEEEYRSNAALAGQRSINRELRKGANAAAARLTYLLGVDPNSELLVLERQLAPFALVDAGVASPVLVEQALTNGPGIRELESLLAVIEQARAKASGPGRYLPTFEATVAEGGFGAGPGDNLKWDNRVDIALQARWNLTDLLTGRERGAVAMAKMQQAQLTFDDLRAKLTMGVREARETILATAEQMALGETRLKEAKLAFDTSYQFLVGREIKAEFKGDVGSVLTAIQGLAAAEADYLRALRAYDQAQIRLFILTGLVDSPQGHLPHHSQPAPHWHFQTPSVPPAPPAPPALPEARLGAPVLTPCSGPLGCAKPQ